MSMYVFNFLETSYNRQCITIKYSLDVKYNKKYKVHSLLNNNNI